MDGKVLVVEPSAVIRQFITQAVNPTGLSVLKVKTGRGALKKLQTDGDDIRIIFTEWFLPDSSGLLLLKQIKALTPKELPLIFVTNESDKDNVLAALKNGASGYIVKPFSNQQILENINKHLT